MGCAVEEQQLIEVSAGGSEYTWPATIYNVNGANISAAPVTVAVVPTGQVPVTWVAPDVLTRGSITIAQYRALYPGDIISPTLGDNDLIYYATVQVLITPGLYPVPPYNLDLWLRLDAGVQEIVRQAAFGISVR